MSTWMVVEDEPSIYEILLTMFEMWGIDGVAFVDGEEAVKWIDDVDHGRHKGEIPELALIDIRLPGRISGPMVGERLRRSTTLKNISVVLTTAYRMSASEEQALRAQAEADDWIQKPLPKFSDLKKRLEHVLTERRLKNAALLPTLVATAATTAAPPVQSSAPTPEESITITITPLTSDDTTENQPAPPPDTLPETPSLNDTSPTVLDDTRPADPLPTTLDL